MENELFDKSKVPDELLLKETIGSSYKLREFIKAELNNKYADIKEEWKYYGAKSGWTMKCFYKKRNLFFLMPHQNYFTIGFVFGDKAVSVIEKSNLPAEIITELKGAKKYAEGRGLRINVGSTDDVNNILKLVEIKVKN
jgi:hypothetical protein